MTEDIERIRALRDQFDIQTQSYQTALTKTLPDSVQDESGEIIVSTGSAEVPIQIEIGSAWRSHYEPATLAAGILHTYGRLATARLGVWAEEVSESQESQRGARPLGSEEADLQKIVREAVDAPPASAEEATAVMARTLEMLEKLDQGLDETIQIVSQRGRATRSGETFSKFAVVTFTVQGDLVDLKFSERWLLAASGQAITAELRDAIAIASEPGNANAVRPDLLDGTPLEGLDSLLSDSSAVMNYLLGRG